MTRQIACRGLLEMGCLIAASSAEAIIVYDFSGSIGMVTGAQAARITVVRLQADAAGARLLCPVTMAIIDRQGRVI